MQLTINEITNIYEYLQRLDEYNRARYYEYMSPELREGVNILASMNNLEAYVVQSMNENKEIAFFEICYHKFLHYKSKLNCLFPLNLNTMTDDILYSKRELIKDQIRSIETSGFYTEADMDRLVQPFRAELELLDNAIAALEANKNI